MHDAAHITMILDIATTAWMIDFCLEKSFKKFNGRYQDLIEKCQRSVKEMVNDSLPRQSLFDIWQDFNRFLCLSILLSDFWL